MSSFATIAAGVASLSLTVWALLRHRRNEVRGYPLSWKGWIVRITLVASGLAFLFFPNVERGWVTFTGAALVALPLFFRQISYEIETRVLSSGSLRRRS
jgi:hypothetical protein